MTVAQVAEMEQLAAKREKEGLQQQTAVARERLKMELGRTLATLGAGAVDPNPLFSQLVKRGGPGGERLKRCLDLLGGLPDWPPELRRELAAFAEGLTAGQKKARQSFTELDAALQDPRWGALECLASAS